MLRFTIAHKLSLLAISIVAITTAAIGFIIYNSSQAQLETVHRATLEQLLNGDKAIILRDITTLRQDLKFLSLLPTMQSFIRAFNAPDKRDPITGLSYNEWRGILERIFVQYMRVKPNYSDIKVIGVENSGLELVRITRSGKVIETATDMSERYGKERFFKQTLAIEPPAVYFSGVRKVPPLLAPTLRAAISMKTQDNKTFGAIIIDLNLTGMLSEIQQNTIRNSILFATDENGSFIIAPDKNALKALRDSLGSIDIPKLLTRVGDKTSGYIEENTPAMPIDGYVFQFQKVFFDPLGPLRFIQLILATPRTDFSVYSYSLGSRTIGMLTLLLSTGVLAAYFMARYFTRPLNQLTTVAKYVGKGSLGEHVFPLPASDDEIGDLARAIIQMQEELRARGEALEESDARFRSMLKYSTLFIYLKDTSCRYILANRRVLEIFHLEEEEIKGKTDAELFPPDEAATLLANEQQILSTGTAMHFEHAVTIDGEKRFFLTSKFPLYDAEGKIVALCGMSLDATDKKRAENRTIESERRFKSILDYSSTVIYLKDMKGRFITVNKALQNVTHLTELEIIGKTDYDLFPKEVADRMVENDRKVIETGRHLTVEEVIPQDDGDHTYLVVKYPLYDAGDHMYAVCGMSTDITERKENERMLHQATAELENRTHDLEEARKQAEAGSRAKGEFLANMSHEIRTPMNNVIGMTELLYNTDLSMEQQEYVEAIYRAGNMLLSIINEILDFSKIEAGELKLAFSNVHIIAILEELRQIFSVRASKNNVAIYIEYDRAVPAIVQADAIRLRQVLINLTNNAIKFTEGGSVTIRIITEEAAEERIILRFEIVDTGIGISPEKQAMIFEKFTQAASYTTKKYGGTGLGLAISKQLVELMGGTIGVTSTIGKGSCFWFRIPFAYAKQEEGENTAQQFTPGNENAPETHYARHITAQFKGKILLVEDYPPNQQLAKKMLEKMGCEVKVSSNGEEAIESLEKEEFDIVFMDCQMPEMDGFEATQKIRSNPKTRNSTIIAMTANALEGDREKCLAVGMNDYISKPIRTSNIEQILRSYLG